MLANNNDITRLEAWLDSGPTPAVLAKHAAGIVRRTLDADDGPVVWDQRNWGETRVTGSPECGYVACVAGIIALELGARPTPEAPNSLVTVDLDLGDGRPLRVGVGELAGRALGLDLEDVHSADGLFSAARTEQEVLAELELIAGDLDG